MFAFRHLLRWFSDLASAASLPHAELRRRLYGISLLTLAMTLIATGAIYWVERHHPESDIRTFWDAFYFMVSQMTTVSAPMSNPVTFWGQALVLIINIYAITVVASLAGMFGAFFHHRSRESAASREETERQAQDRH